MVKKIEINWETNELNYLFGGYFSAIGSIWIYKGNQSEGSYYLRTSIHFDELRIAKLFQKSFGGNIGKNSTPTHWKQHRARRNIIWVTNGSHSFEFLNSIEPYIIDKKVKKKIVVAKAYYNYQQKNFSGKSERVRKQKHKYYLQMRRLK